MVLIVFGVSLLAMLGLLVLIVYSLAAAFRDDEEQYSPKE